MAIVDRKPCDEKFDRDEKALSKAVENLRGSAQACVLQAASDLSRVARKFRDADVQILGARLRENLTSPHGFENILAACQEYTDRNRRSIDHRNPSGKEVEMHFGQQEDPSRYNGKNRDADHSVP